MKAIMETWLFRIVRIVSAIFVLLCIRQFIVWWPLVIGCVLVVLAAAFVSFEWPYKIIMAVFRRGTKSYYVGMVHPFKLKVLWHPANVTPNERMQKHENWHLVQIKENGTMKFLLLYLAYLIWYGYEASPFEVDARAHE